MKVEYGEHVRPPQRVRLVSRGRPIEVSYTAHASRVCWLPLWPLWDSFGDADIAAIEAACHRHRVAATHAILAGAARGRSAFHRAPG